jgi:two-component system sensor histidine kinase BaeS
LNLVQVSLNEWLTHTLAPWKTAAADKKIEWKENYSAGLPVIQADPVRLEQMVGNLVDNAIKYTAPGGQVTIESGEDSREIYIRVIDTGIGIPLEEQSKIFNPFFRGDQGKRIKQGMGLGLSIANELAIAHNGRIELVSAPHQGSTFTLWLPAS